VKVIVADDELQARKRVARLLTAMPDVDVAAVCASGEEVLALLPTVRPDALVIDISMPGLSGLETHALLPADGPYVVFVTAHAEHAVEAFDLGALDYVVKPVTAARLARAIDRIRRAAVPAPAATIDRLAVETRAGIVLLDPAAITYARFDGALVEVVCGRETYTTTMTLVALEERLGAGFERVDRRHVLNVREIARLEPQPTGGYVAVTRDGHRVPVSRQAGRLLCKQLGV
jgi:two-component system LytT family response regulator